MYMNGNMALTLGAGIAYARNPRYAKRVLVVLLIR